MRAGSLAIVGTAFVAITKKIHDYLRGPEIEEEIEAEIY